MLVESRIVQTKYPEVEQMPNGYICPGYDLRLMQPLAVLKYLFGVKTQWSCQGTHKAYKARAAYILLAADEQFPSELVSLMDNAGVKVEIVDDVDINLKSTGKNHLNLRSCTNPKELIEIELELLNEQFLNILNNWAKEKIKENLSKMMKDNYYKDVVSMYS
jgi:hypothetical protein